MHYKVLKAGFDGICGGESRYDTIRDVLQEIHYAKGWESLDKLHTTIEKWAKQAEPGSVFCTQASAIIALPTDKSCRQVDLCHHCDYEGLDYEEIEGVESGDLEQTVTCPNCDKKWIDVFSLTDQREQFN